MLKTVLEHREYWKPRDQLRCSWCNLGGVDDAWDGVVRVVLGSGQIPDLFQSEPRGFPYN